MLITLVCGGRCFFVCVCKKRIQHFINHIYGPDFIDNVGVSRQSIWKAKWREKHSKCLPIEQNNRNFRVIFLYPLFQPLSSKRGKNHTQRLLACISAEQNRNILHWIKRNYIDFFSNMNWSSRSCPFLLHIPIDWKIFSEAIEKRESERETEETGLPFGKAFMWFVRCAKCANCKES